MEGQADEVAGREEVGEAVDVGGDVVGALGVQGWEEGLDGFGEDEGLGGRGRCAEGCVGGGCAGSGRGKGFGDLEI